MQEEEVAANDVGASILFSFLCRRCPGGGVVWPKRPGIDWPEPCACESRKAFSLHQLARILDEEPRTLMRLDRLQTRDPMVAARLLDKVSALLVKLGES